MKGKKNNITTLGYFTKRIRDSGFVALKIFDSYSESDSRKWTVVVDPGNSSLFITCYVNKNFNGEYYFEFNDGGVLFPKNYNLKTKSMEIIVTMMIEKGVSQKSEGCLFEKKD